MTNEEQRLVNALIHAAETACSHYPNSYPFTIGAVKTAVAACEAAGMSKQHCTNCGVELSDATRIPNDMVALWCNLCSKRFKGQPLLDITLDSKVLIRLDYEEGKQTLGWCDYDEYLRSHVEDLKDAGIEEESIEVNHLTRIITATCAMAQTFWLCLNCEWSLGLDYSHDRKNLFYFFPDYTRLTLMEQFEAQKKISDLYYYYVSKPENYTDRLRMNRVSDGY